MAREVERGAAAERMAVVAMGVGVLGVAGGAAVIALGTMTGGLPGLQVGWLGAVLIGSVLALLGFGQVMRGIHLNATIDTLANVRLLQEETHRARTQAALHAHAVREPMQELRPVAKMEKPVQAVPSTAATAKPLERPKVVATNVSQMPTPAQPAAAQTARKATKKEPIVGKPFQPHPIFMARPPR